MNSMWGHMVYDLMVPQNHFLRALKELISWESSSERLISVYQGRAVIGAPPYDPVMVLKMLFLSYLYGLSMRDTERFVNESIPAHYFLDLAITDRAPDHSSISVFNGRLIKAGAVDILLEAFDSVLQQARDQGLRFGTMQLLDSVHTEADVNAQKDKAREKKGKSPRDPDARLVQKGEREVVEPDGTKVKKKVIYRGYKTHISMDADTRIVTSILPNWGNSADNKAFPDLFAHDLSLGLPTHTYGGDKAYDDTDIFERIEQQGMCVGIKLRRFRTLKKNPNKERWIALKQTPEYQMAIKLRYRVEQPFGQAKDKHGFERCRYLGLTKYRIQATMTFMAVNTKRIVKLLTGITFRELAKGVRKEAFEPVYATPPWA
jgi:transposase